MHSKCLIFTLALLLSFGLQGQDLHFTQNHYAPLNLNPAMTGAFYGSYRAGGIYRDQYRTVQQGTNAKPFQTVSIFIDSPIIGGFRKQDWIGVGFNLYRDQAGEAKLVNVGQLLSVAYHLGLGKKNVKNVLTIGAQYGAVQRSIDKSNILTRADLESGSFTYENGAPIGMGTDPYFASLSPKDMDKPNILGKSTTHISAGLMLTSELGKTADLRIGASVAHFLRPGQAITGSEFQDRRAVRTNGFAAIYADMGQRFTLMPSIYFQNMLNSNELVIQTRGALQMTDDISINAGLGVRIVNAADLQIMLGMDKGNISVGLAYDLNILDFTDATNGSSGFELAVSYIGKIYKKPKVEPILICPRL